MTQSSNNLLSRNYRTENRLALQAGQLSDLNSELYTINDEWGTIMFTTAERDAAIIKTDNKEINCENCEHCYEAASGLACKVWCCGVESNEVCSDFEQGLKR